MLILEEATREAFGYISEELSRGSHKQIINLCCNCGKLRICKKKNYYPLCQSCCHKSDCLSTKAIKNMAEARKGKKFPLCGRNMKGKSNPRWVGGVSFEPYCTKFDDEYKQMIREKFGNVCFLCNKSKFDNNRELGVHHVNYNKNCGCDETKCICVPLCMRCHTKTNGDRDFWQCLVVEMLKPMEAWE